MYLIFFFDTVNKWNIIKKICSLYDLFYACTILIFKNMHCNISL